MSAMGTHQKCRTLLLRELRPPGSIDGPSVSRPTHHLDTSCVLHVCLVGSCGKRHVTINTLPDDVLLNIFVFDRLTYLEEVNQLLRLSWRWCRLVHVCWRWRSVIFASPKFLGLRLVFGPRTRVEIAGIWPPLPIIIRNRVRWPMPGNYDFNAAIMHHSRVREIDLHYVTCSQLQRLASAMQEQFPALVHLMLQYVDYRRPAVALPDEFLGGSAQRLRSLELSSIPYPALPKLLLSATDLVRLTLGRIPHSGYISPEAIVNALSVLANLKSLTIRFQSPLSRPGLESRRPPPQTRAILPALTRFEFKGVSEYLEDLVARINAPLLNSISITFFHQLIYDVPRLAQFMRHTTIFLALDEAHVVFGDYNVQVNFLLSTRTFDAKSRLRILCRELDWQRSSLLQVFTSFFPSIHRVEHLHIYEPEYFPSREQDDIENMEWLEFFHPFTSMKNLYVSKEIGQCIATALQELVGEKVTVVLPILECVFLEELSSGPVRKAIGQFIAARQFAGRPVAISHWNGISQFW